MASIDSTISKFLKGVLATDYPKIAVIGIAGAVVNNSVHTTNVPHWTFQDGFSIAQNQNFESFTFINDFAAAGYGICMLQ